MKVKKLVLICISCLCMQGMYAQRHYSGITGVECNYGLNTFGRNNTLLNLSVSKYKNRTTLLEMGLSYFEKSHVFQIPSQVEQQSTTVCSTAKDYFLDATYSKTIATNLSFFYLNLGLGAFIGAEKFAVPDGKKYDFILGPQVKAETEIFILPRVALLVGITQFWSPFSGISKWNTVWNTGVKVLIY